MQIVPNSDLAGPILFLNDIRDNRLVLAAVFVSTGSRTPGPVRTPETTVEAKAFWSLGQVTLHRAIFEVPADAPGCYWFEDQYFELASNLSSDVRIAYVSCNGEEIADLERRASERNVMWSRLCDQHQRSGFSLLLHGGDQVYADEATHGHPLTAQWPSKVPAEATPDQLADLRSHLLREFVRRYIARYSCGEFLWIAARVPSLMQWDDHDICDGWGSLPDARQNSPVGQTVFSVARQTFLAFQHGCTEKDLPARFRDPDASHLGWVVNAPGFRIVAPDLRSQRRRTQVMGTTGWDMMRRVEADYHAGKTFLMSSVPLLGPRLSILEKLLTLVPRMQKYEDDLRDQWQSRAHRQEWRQMLGLLVRMATEPAQSVSILSGEIHLATRATMAIDSHTVLHQLVASGIAHRAPPKIWAYFLGMLASLGEQPLKDHPVRIAAIPGQRCRYTAQRNFLVLARQHGSWECVWDLEHDGLTPPLRL